MFVSTSMARITTSNYMFGFSGLGIPFHQWHLCLFSAHLKLLIERRGRNSEILG